MTVIERARTRAAIDRLLEAQGIIEELIKGYEAQDNQADNVQLLKLAYMTTGTVISSIKLTT